MTYISIRSAFATRENYLSDDFTAPMTWTGEVEGVNLDTVYRFFNRVDEADSARLAALGYRLPSLSVGDLVTIGTATFQVVNLGFEPVAVPSPCGYCRRCSLHDDPGGCLEVERWEREQVGA
jgi:hypothetical protein